MLAREGKETGKLRKGLCSSHEHKWLHALSVVRWVTQPELRIPWAQREPLNLTRLGILLSGLGRMTKQFLYATKVFDNPFLEASNSSIPPCTGAAQVSGFWVAVGVLDFAV